MTLRRTLLCSDDLTSSEQVAQGQSGSVLAVAQNSGMVKPSSSLYCTYLIEIPCSQPVLEETVH